jgi:Fur family transcriptional regulator, stress-responsive regulator
MPDDPAQLLRQFGLQVTAQRLAVLRAVGRRPHCTADEVADAVRKEIGAISRQAVYDALGMLSEKGVIRRIRPAGSPTLYEDRVGDNHHHLICRKCGQTVDVDCAVASAPRLTASQLTAAAAVGYEIEVAEVIYWGVCPSCQNSSANVVSATTANSASRSGSRKVSKTSNGKTSNGKTTGGKKSSKKTAKIPPKRQR